MDKECPYLIPIAHGSYKSGKCQITNELCPYIRLCRTRNKIVSSPLYTINGCNVQNKYESEDNING